MPLPLTAEDRAELEAAAAAERRSRGRRRFPAVLLPGDGEPAPGVARRLGCGASSVDGWAAAGRSRRCRSR